MYNIVTFTDCIHINEDDERLTITIDKPSEVHNWLKILQGYYRDNPFDILYCLIESEIAKITENY